MRRFIVIAMCMVCATAIPAFAQDDSENDVNVGIKFGWFILQDDDLKEFFDNDMSYGIEIIKWFTSSLGLAVEIDYFTTDYSEDIGTLTLTNLPVHVDIYYRKHLGQSDFSTYWGAGPTLLFTSIKYAGFGRAEISDQTFGVNVVGGIQWKRVLLEGRYYYAKPDFEVEADDNHGGFNVMFGIRF